MRGARLNSIVRSCGGRIPTDAEVRSEQASAVEAEMSSNTIDPAKLDEQAADVDLSIKQANQTKVPALLVSIRAGVMRRANVLPAELPPSLVFDPQ